MVKERGGRNNSVCAAVNKEAEIAVMPVRVENQGIENEHIIQCVLKFSSQLFIILSNCLHSARANYSPHRNKRNILACEELAGRAERILPF